MDHYTFPHISHISQVLAAIKDKPEFIVAERDRHTIINYMVNSNSTFPRVLNPTKTTMRSFNDAWDVNAALLRECRGIVFGPTGTVIARRFHKFFNVGEREETFLETMDFSKRHHIIEKLDGSMITPIPIYRNPDCVGKGMYSLRWGTKMGITLVAMQAEEYIAGNAQIRYQDFANECIYHNMTPIFEWCSRKQRIVVDYPKDRLTLIAIRHNVTGDYLYFPKMHTFARGYGIPVVSWLPDEEIGNGEEFVSGVREKEDIEGYVVRFEDGHMVKIKGDWYCRIHRAKDSILQEKRVVEMIINEKVDDVLPFLLDNDKKALSSFVDDFTSGLVKTLDTLWDAYQKYYLFYDGDRKKFAIDTSHLPHTGRACMFAVWDKTDKQELVDHVKGFIRKNLGSRTKVESVRWLWGDYKWADYIQVEEEDADGLGL